MQVSPKKEIPVNENQEKVIDDCMFIDRNYSWEFTVGSKKFGIPANTQKKERVKEIENAINGGSFSDTEKKALIGFCNNFHFSSQEMFSFPYPGFQDTISIGTNGDIDFVVEIDANGDTHVKAKAKGKMPQGQGLAESIKNFQSKDLEISVHAESTLSFTYKGGIVASKGIIDDIRVQEYNQEITFE